MSGIHQGSGKTHIHQMGTYGPLCLIGLVTLVHPQPSRVF